MIRMTKYTSASGAGAALRGSTPGAALGRVDLALISPFRRHSVTNTINGEISGRRDAMLACSIVHDSDSLIVPGYLC